MPAAEYYSSFSDAAVVFCKQLCFSPAFSDEQFVDRCSKQIGHPLLRAKKKEEFCDMTLLFEDWLFCCKAQHDKIVYSALKKFCISRYIYFWISHKLKTFSCVQRKYNLKRNFSSIFYRTAEKSLFYQTWLQWFKHTEKIINVFLNMFKEWCWNTFIF